MRNGLLIALTFLFAFILTLLPLPDWAIWIRPAWVLLVLIYWNISIPYQVNVGTAFFLGILLDVLNGTLLGEYALAMTIASFFAIKIHVRMRMFPLLQQGLCVLLIVFIYQFVIYCVQAWINELPKSKLYWMSSVVSMLLWPWVVTILRNLRWQKKFSSM